ncbi:MAG TPA: hypothetical protein VMN37_05650 [Gemmatimonadales bacterium]|nr:hypothetical protein [Gemmatimonadales bacterium]
MLGLGLGAAVGVATGFFLARDCQRPAVNDPELCNLAYAITIPAGAGLGALLGSRVRSNHWVAVPMGDTALLLGAPGSHRSFSLGLSVRP